MRIGRTIPPAANPIRLTDLVNSVTGLFNEKGHIERLETELKSYTGSKHIFLCSSGKAALTIILRALKKLSPEKDTAIIPAYTCPSVPAAVFKAGLKARIVDIEEKKFGIDIKLVEKAITENTLCAVTGRLFGIPTEMKAIRKACGSAYIIEDAAQGFGVEQEKQAQGPRPDARFFSLGRGKNMTCAEGGIIAADSDEIAFSIRQEFSGLERPSPKELFILFIKAVAMSCLTRPWLYWLPSGIPALKLGETIYPGGFEIKRFTGMQAKLLGDWRDKLDKANKARARAAKEYIDALSIGLEPLPYIKMPLLADSKETRDRIVSESRKEGLGLAPVYPRPVNTYLKTHEYEGASFPVAKKISETLLTLPTHQFVTKKDIKKICRLVKEHMPEKKEPIQDEAHHNHRH